MKMQKLNERGEGLISGLIALVFGIIITFVALRFVFGIFNISALSGFIGWVYDVTDPLVWPFFSVLGREVPALEVALNSPRSWHSSSTASLAAYLSVCSLV